MKESNTQDQLEITPLDLLTQLNELRISWEEEQAARAKGGILALSGFEHQFLLVLLKMVKQWRMSSEIERDKLGITQNVFTELLSDITEISLDITFTQSKITLSEKSVREAIDELWLIFSLALKKTPNLIGRLNFVISGKCDGDKSPMDIINGWGTRSGKKQGVRDQNLLAIFKNSLKWESLPNPKESLIVELEKLARDEDASTTISRWLGYLLQLGSGISPEQVSSLIWRELKLDTSLTAFRKTLARILSKSHFRLRAVRSTLGRSISLPRVDCLTHFKQSILNHQLTILTGDSGSGKSALCKLAIQTEFQDHYRLFFQAIDIVNFSEGVSTDVEIRRLDELLTAQILDQTIIFVEDIDNVSDQIFNSVFTFLQNVFSTDVAVHLRVVLVTHSNAEHRIREKIARHFGTELSIGVLNLPQLPIDELLANDSLPISIKILLGRAKQFGSALNLKLLDWLVASDSVTDEDFSRLNNDLDLLKWFWHNHVGNIHDITQENEILTRISLALADKFSLDIPLSDLYSFNGNIQAITEATRTLVRLDCIRIAENRVSITHRFVGDCTRFYFLLGNYREIDVIALTEKLRNPLWLKPIQWFALSLVINTDKNDIWHDLLKEAIRKEQLQVIDLLLDGAILSKKSYNILTEIPNNITPLILERIFSRLHATAFTFVDPILNLSYERMSLSEKLKASKRIVGIPNLIFWLPILHWILDLPKEILLEVSEEFFTVAKSWINWGEFIQNFPLRREVAILTLDLAETLLFPVDNSSKKQYWHDQSSEIFSCIVFSLKLEPEKAMRLLRILAGREVIPANKLPETEQHPLFNIPINLTEAHPRGSQAKVNRSFQKFMLGRNDQYSPDGLYLHAVVIVNPQLASELLLALTIAPPDYPFHESPYIVDDDLGLSSSHEIEVCTFKYMPLLSLLNSDEAIGIDIVETLCNIAVDNWHQYRWQTDRLEGYPKTDTDGITLLVSNKRRFFRGGRDSLYWHCKHHSSPDVLACFLMTLENWLYNRPTKKDLERSLALIFDRTNTVPMLGVLISIAKHDPSLLKTALLPLISSLQLFLWLRFEALDQGQCSMFDSRIWSLSEEEREEVINFHRQAHRKLSILEIMLSMWRKKEISIEIISQILEDWDCYQIDQIPSISQLSATQFRAELDPSSWQIEVDEEGNHGFQFVGHIPEDFEASERAIKANLNLCQMSLIMQFRQILEGKESLSIERCKFLVEFLTTDKIIEEFKEQFGVQRLKDMIWGAIAVLLENTPNIKELSQKLDDYLNIIADKSLSTFRIYLNHSNRCQHFDCDDTAFTVRAAPKLLHRIKSEQAFRTSAFRCLIGQRNRSTTEFMRTFIREYGLSHSITHDLIKVIPKISRLISLTQFLVPDENTIQFEAFPEIEQSWSLLQDEFARNSVIVLSIVESFEWLPNPLSTMITEIPRFPLVQYYLDWSFLAAALEPVFSSDVSDDNALLILKSLREQFFSALLSERKTIAEKNSMRGYQYIYTNEYYYEPQPQLLKAAILSAPLKTLERINEIFGYIRESDLIDYILLKDIIINLQGQDILETAMAIGDFLIEIRNASVISCIYIGKEHDVWKDLIKLLASNTFQNQQQYLASMDAEFSKFFEKFCHVMISSGLVRVELYKVASRKPFSQYRRLLFALILQTNLISEVLPKYKNEEANLLVHILASLWENDQKWLKNSQARLTVIRNLIGHLQEIGILGAEQLGGQIANDLAFSN